MTATNTHPILEIRSVDQVYRLGFMMKRTQVLFDVSFVVKPNTIFGLLGANGAGKTTLIKSVVGLHRPTRGEVRVGGVPAYFLEAKTKIGYLPERPYFPDHLTGEALLHYMGALSGMKKHEITARIPGVLKTVSMTHAGGTELRRYSKGMLQRIGVAQAILHDPELLVLDEPMSGLDPLGRKEIRDLMVRLKNEGKSVFFTTHIIQDAEAICEEIALLEKGRLVSAGPVMSFLSKGPYPVEICLGGVTDALERKLLGRKEKIPEGLKVVLESEAQVGKTLETCLAEKAQILSVVPLRPSLEDLYKRID